MKVIDTNTVKTTNYEISGEDIVAALKNAGKIPQNAEVKDIFVRVPGGGDKSVFIRIEEKKYEN